MHGPGAWTDGGQDKRSRDLARYARLEYGADGEWFLANVRRGLLRSEGNGVKGRPRPLRGALRRVRAWFARRPTPVASPSVAVAIAIPLDSCDGAGGGNPASAAPPCCA